MIRTWTLDLTTATLAAQPAGTPYLDTEPTAADAKADGITISGSLTAGGAAVRLLIAFGSENRADVHTARVGYTFADLSVRCPRAPVGPQKMAIEVWVLDGTEIENIDGGEIIITYSVASSDATSSTGL